MAGLSPIYSRHNCRFVAPLQWTLTVFWREAEPGDAWLPELTAALEADGIRLISHRFTTPTSSQFAISTLPHVAPKVIVQRTKGRLAYLVRSRKSGPLQRNFAIRSIGNSTREAVENYIADQLGHHRMADPRVQHRLAEYQICCPNVDLSQQQTTSHGIYWHNLHLVFVHRDRWCETRHEQLSKIKSMVVSAASKHSCRLSRAAVLPDHVHLLMGCPFVSAPDEIALSFLNNLAFAQGMKPVYQFGGFVGTVGEYTNKALRGNR